MFILLCSKILWVEDSGRIQWQCLVFVPWDLDLPLGITRAVLKLEFSCICLCILRCSFKDNHCSPYNDRVYCSLLNFSLCFLMLISFIVQGKAEQPSALDMNKISLSDCPVVISGYGLTDYQEGPLIFAKVYCGVFNTKCHSSLTPTTSMIFIFASNLYWLNGLSP